MLLNNIWKIVNYEKTLSMLSMTYAYAGNKDICASIVK